MVENYQRVIRMTSQL